MIRKGHVYETFMYEKTVPSSDDVSEASELYSLFLN